MKTASKVIVKQTEQNPVPVEVLAEAIVSISAGIKKLRAGPLNERCLLLLIQNAAPFTINQKQVRTVLDGIEQLEHEYLKPRKPS